MIPLVYDQVNGWGKDDEFFLTLLKKVNAKELADLGCGTGRLTTHFAKAGYHVTAIDPNEQAIACAKGKEGADAVTWIIGDSADLDCGSFDTVIMTANVAQVFLTDKSWKNTISAVYRALKPGGHFIFDARNPLAKAWEQWMEDETPDLAIDGRSGEPLEVWTEYDGFIEDIFTFYETVKIVRTGELVVHEKMQLKFRTEEELSSSLRQAGFSQVQAYEDWEFKTATAEAKSFIFHCTK